MKWITREKAAIDRIACPWLISRFIDDNPEFIFVPAAEVMKDSKELSAIPFDVEGAELNHYHEDGEERVTFDAVMRKYKLSDPALKEFAKIVRAADAHEAMAVPESPGLKSIAQGFRLISKNDHENMDKQFPVYDALYAYCKYKLESRRK